MNADDAINQRIFETSLDLILVVSQRGDFLRVSPSARAIIGYRPDEMIGRSAVDFIHPDDLESTRREMRMARKGRLTRNFDCRYIHKDGHAVPLSWTGVWSEPEGQHFFIGRDMTERIAAESQLRQAQKMEAIGQLTGGIAHDFNNLLTVVLGNLELAEARARNDAQLHRHIAAAASAAQKGADLTTRLLAFSRRQDLQIRVMDINALIDGMELLLRRALGETIEINTALAGDLWPTAVDPVQFEAAVLNLAVNARDAMPAGGKLIIETANVHLDEQYAAQNGIAAGPYVKAGVTDTGGGMPPDVVDRVFEPFFTTKDVNKGTGLGLAMVYGFIKQLGGHIKVYSEVGRGTTFNIYLPKSEDNAAADRQRSGDGARRRARTGEKILVAEDDPDVRIVVTAMIEGLGYEIVEASDGPSALALLEDGCACHLLFTDMVMSGGMSGSELAARAVALRPQMKVLFASGYPRDALPELGREAMVLRKPYDIAGLAEAIRHALDA